MQRAMLLLALSLALVSCGQAASTPDSQPPSPDPPAEFIGEFYCSGHEYGMLAFAGILTIREGGSVAIAWMYSTDPAEGTWRYESSRAELTFSADLEISHAHYDDVVGQLEVHLREGVERAHVETGVMYCQRQ